VIRLKKHIIYLFLILGIFHHACTEPIDVSTLSFESVIVVNARITNQFKYQEVLLSNSFPLEGDEYIAERNASVLIVDDTGNQFDFYESETPGKYISSKEFEAEPGRSYQLKIIRDDGKNYESKTTQLTQVTQIDNLYAERGLDGRNNDGMFIYVDSSDPNGNSKYYQYEYEETYQIVAPFWVPQELVVNEENNPFFRYSIIDKTTEQKTCYNTVNSNDIIQTTTTDLTDDEVNKFQVRFVNGDDPIISHRYSILVKQYVQSLDAYTYYKTVKKLSVSENVFSQNQPGFIQGNIVSVDSQNEKVIGMFEVSSVSEKRLFFDYDDFYPDASELFYFVNCEFSKPMDVNLTPSANPPPLQREVMDGLVKYFDFNQAYPDDNFPNEGPIIVVTSACGDCTEFGTNVKPSFWE